MAVAKRRSAAEPRVLLPNHLSPFSTSVCSGRHLVPRDAPSAERDAMVSGSEVRA